MAVDTKLPYDQDYINQFSQEQNEPEWMRDLRLQALEKANALEMPKPDKTRISKWNFSEFKHASQGEKLNSLDELPAEIQEFLDKENESENLLIQRNNTVAYASISKELQEKGVILTDIFTAMNKHENLVKKYFMKDAASIDEHRLTALHAALLNGGVFVYVPKNVQLEEPLHAIFWQEDPEVALFNHVLIVAEESSSLTYVENYISHNQDEKTVANIVSEVIALDNAKIDYGAVDNFAAGTTTYVNRRGVAYRDARIDWALGQMNNGNTISENVTRLEGDNSFTYPKAVTVGVGKQSQNFTTEVENAGKNTQGYILQHGVMKDSASTIFNGIGRIRHLSAETKAYQESRLLMLSERARGDANPILLIDDDDIEEAGHAASVGRVDPLQMYYLMSRGITKQEAERLLIHGFLTPVVGQLPIEAVRKQLTDVIERKVY